MVAQNAVRTYGVNQVFRLVTWLNRKSRLFRFFLRKELVYFIPAQLVLRYHITIKVKKGFVEGIIRGT